MLASQMMQCEYAVLPFIQQFLIIRRFGRGKLRWIFCPLQNFEQLLLSIVPVGMAP